MRNSRYSRNRAGGSALLSVEENHQPADDEEDIDADCAFVDEELPDRAARLEVEENLHEVVADHGPRGKRAQGLH
jgi:hypothetical protein